MFIQKLFSHKNKSGQNVPKSLLQKFIGINNTPQSSNLTPWKVRFFQTALKNRINKAIFEQHESTLIIRGKLINMLNLHKLFDKFFSFKKIFDIFKPYLLEVSFLFFYFCV